MISDDSMELKINTTLGSMDEVIEITKDGVDVVMPGEEPETAIDAQGNEHRQFETVATDLVFDEPDYSRVVARAGKDAGPMRAIYIAAGVPSSSTAATP